MTEFETTNLIHTARDQALAFITADPVLQHAGPSELQFCLGGILRMEHKAGETDITKLANLAVRKLRHREQAKLAAASIYKKYGRPLPR